MGGRVIREFGMDTYTLLYLKWITHKDYRTALRTLHNIM